MVPFPFKGITADFSGAPANNIRLHPFTAFSDFGSPWNKGLIGFDSNLAGLHLWYMQADGGSTGDWISIPRLDVAENVTAAWNFAKTGSGVVPFTVASNGTGKVTYLNSDMLDGYHAVSDPSAAAVQNFIPVYDTSGTLRVATPTATDHAANKGYVDGLSTGLRALAGGPARLATTGVIADLTAVSTSMDGGTIVAGDRILVKDTASPDGIVAASHAYDGVYVAGTPGGGTVALTRATDADTTAELTAGAYILVTAGTVNAGHSYSQTVVNPTVDTTALNWVLFFQTSTYSAGNGIDLTGTVFSLKVNAGTTWTANGVLYGATTSTLANSANFTYASGILGVTNSGVGFQHTSGSLVLATKNDGSTGSIGTTSNHALTFMANNATAGTLTAAGKLGIGTASPGAFIHTLGTTEQFRAGYDTSNYLSLSIGAAGAVAMTTVGTGAGFTFTMTNNAAFTVAGGQVTGSGATGLLVMSDTWNTSGTPTLIYANVSDSSSNAASLLMSLAVGGSSKFSVKKDGLLTSISLATGAASFSGAITGTDITVAGTGTFDSMTVTTLTANQYVLTDGTNNFISSATIPFSAITGTVPPGQGGTGLTSYAVGDLIYASGATTLSALADVATGNVLLSGGLVTAPAWGKVGLTTHVTGTLPATNGGTGFASYAVGDIPYADTTTSLAKLADVATGRVLISGGVGVAPSWSQTTGITGVGTLVAGAISTGFGAITIAGTVTAGALVGGTLDVSSDTNLADVTCGSFYCTASGAFEGYCLANQFILAATTVAGGGTSGMLEYDDVNRWLYFSRIYSGASVTRLKVAQVFMENVGDGSSTSITVTHNLGTSNPAAISLRKASTGALWSCNVVVLNSNQIRLDFGTAPTLIAGVPEFVVAVVG